MGARKLGKIKHIGRVFDCQFTGDKKRTVTVEKDGESFKSYLVVDSDVLNQIKVGKSVEFEMIGKSAKIFPLNRQNEQEDFPSINFKKAEKRAQELEVVNAALVKKQIIRNLKLFRWTFDKVAEEFDDHNLKTESIKEITTTLVIQSFKKFPL